MEEIIYYRDHIMVPVDANIYLLEAWEIILIIGVMFAIGFMLGMYITTQINSWIKKQIKNDR